VVCSSQDGFAEVQVQSLSGMRVNESEESGMFCGVSFVSSLGGKRNNVVRFDDENQDDRTYGDYNESGIQSSYNSDVSEESSMFSGMPFG
jgi:hypothetical protein